MREEWAIRVQCINALQKVWFPGNIIITQAALPITSSRFNDNYGHRGYVSEE